MTNSTDEGSRSLCALILAPTRELSIQVADHLNQLILKLYPKGDSAGDASRNGDAKGPPPVSVAAIVGGMSVQKQKRIIERGIDIIVATPGRLWDLLEEVGYSFCATLSNLANQIYNQDEGLAESIRNIRFLVLDEADRMIETGHFKELEKIIKLTLRVSAEYVTNFKPDPSWFNI